MKRIKRFSIWIFVLILSTAACKETKMMGTSNAATLPANISLNGKLFTSLFQQKAAEYRALCLQAYNIARYRIENYKPKTNKKLAIITDIDETLLDNSPYAVHQAYQGKEFDPASWYTWTSKADADTMPGAGSFLHYCASKNVEVFYITNRDEKERENTILNLKKFGLPYADGIHMLTKQTSSAKEPRRQYVMQDHEVILLMGDNLSDFSSLFDKKNMQDRSSQVTIFSAEFGDRFIVLPNANYGDWEGSLYHYKYNYNQAQKDSIMKSVLKSY
ncbi:MAG: 5'-nucleotidase, lipoprotein e(P4) family [Niastella sp.]|nr:5'-nucleotidase, lipoprotein e(P4) family [Niastella sp.]